MKQFNNLKYFAVAKNDHPIEEVRLTVDPTDNPNLPVLTFRTWVLGVSSCILLSFANMFFAYRANPLTIGSVCVQIITLPVGRLMASTLPKKNIKVPLTDWSFSLNPGPFSMKEHCLITIFAGAGAGGLYAIHIVTIVKAFYRRDIHPMAALLLAETTQVRRSPIWWILRICGGRQTSFKSPFVFTEHCI